VIVMEDGGGMEEARSAGEKVMDAGRRRDRRREAGKETRDYEARRTEAEVSAFRWEGFGIREGRER